MSGHTSFLSDGQREGDQADFGGMRKNAERNSFRLRTVEGLRFGSEQARSFLVSFVAVMSSIPT
jgi:hypothetical protein